ncbi:MotA/TolQ/ExbB proton channel family protein [Methylobacter tundripaludum]|uniref:MotA/TolQ/ExbB proton channel family protein n=1 Tax=Methylobacter tundripaludum TaxID=173365 RepID=UPI000489EF65|nr:MotA/TolQ/ExbB proton channel family protein [Methylobacter tundripaludum]
MTETTSAATAIPPAANQIPVSGADIASAASATPAAPEITSALIVDATLWILIGFSVVTWALILIKGIQHLRISQHNRSYGKKFWGAQDFQAAAALEGNKGPAARVADIGFTTLIEADGGTTTHDLEHTGDRQELLDRRLRQQMQKERGALESGLAILATIGSISPFVGLFGTVWGIMGALTSISKSGSASLDVVAGPIGEALIATAVGIAVAVPAVIGYNFFIRRNKVIWAFLDDFAIDFVHLALKTSFLIKRPVSGSVASPRTSGTGAKHPVLKASHEDLQAEGAQI